MPLSENYKTHHEKPVFFLIAKISFRKIEQTKNIANPKN